MKEVLEKAKNLINEKCANRQYNLAELTDLGFEKKSLLNPRSARLIHDEYFMQNSDASKKISVMHICYDPSGPFQNIPDVHKFTIDYFEIDVKADSMQNEFSE